MMIESETGGGDTNDSETNDTTTLLKIMHKRRRVCIIERKNELFVHKLACNSRTGKECSMLPHSYK